MKEILYIGLILSLLTSCVFAQETIRLSLEEAQKLAQQQNPNLQIQTNMVSAQKGRYWDEIIPENPEFGVEYGTQWLYCCRI